MLQRTSDKLLVSRLGFEEAISQRGILVLNPKNEKATEMDRAGRSTFQVKGKAAPRPGPVQDAEGGGVVGSEDQATARFLLDER